MTATRSMPARRVEDQASFVPVLDQVLSRIAADPAIEAMGAGVLKNDMGNPFAFFSAYKEAAGKLGKPRISQEALEVLRHLERKYAR